MGAIQGYFATSGIGSVIGAVLGWIIFSQTATAAPNCVPPGSDTCLEAFGMTFIPFVIVVAACGGVIGLFVQIVRGEVL
jgi:hypothetical protein